MSVAFQDLIPGNNCWGCGPNNAQGLHTKSYWDGDEAVCEWQPRPPYFAGPEHILNGGIIATLVDCHGVCTAIADIYRSEGREIGSPPDVWCATASLNLTYLRPVPIDEPVVLRARVLERADRRITVACSLSSAGKERARAELVAVRVPESWRHGGEPTRR